MTDSSLWFTPGPSDRGTPSRMLPRLRLIRNACLHEWLPGDHWGKLKLCLAQSGMYGVYVHVGASMKKPDAPTSSM